MLIPTILSVCDALKFFKLPQKTTQRKSEVSESRTRLTGNEDVWQKGSSRSFRTGTQVKCRPSFWLRYS